MSEHTPSPWIELALLAGAHDVETLEDALLAAGALAVTLQDDADEPVLEPLPGETPLWSQTRVTGLFDAQTDLEAVKAQLREQLGTAALPEPLVRELEERDWVRAWMDDFHPMRFGRRLWVVPTNQAPPDPAAVNLLLDPGLAFGTGTHPTTALCLEWLDGAELGGLRVLDYGCGSGILAIAALRLGAAAAWGVDIDPQALTASAENAERNGVAEALTLCMPGALAVDGVDVLVANILAGPLVMLAAELAARVRPGGGLALSGILAEQAEAVQAAYAPWFELAPLRQREDWVLISGQRRR